MTQGGGLRRHLAVFIVIGCALCGMLLFPAQSVQGYSVVLRSDPPDGALLDGSARSIKLWFNHAVVLPANQVSLVDAQGKDIPLRDVRVKSYFPKREGLASQFDENYLFLCAIGSSSWPSLVVIDLPDLAGGAYRLTWNSIGLEDRQESGGMLTFGVDPSVDMELNLSPLSHSQKLDDLLVSFAVEPNRPGSTFLTVRVADLRRPAAAPIEQVQLSMTPPDGGYVLHFEATDHGGGRYQAYGADLPTAGEWDVTVIVSRAGLPDVHYDLIWSLPEQPTTTVTMGWSVVSVGLISVLFIAAATSGLYLRRRRD
jgi:methionine-rich copper-binding protein CopC